MKQKPLKDLLLISWLVPMACTVLGGCGLAFGLSYLDFSNYKRSENDRLRELAPTIVRRVQAELLLGEQGTLEPVIAQLKGEFGLSVLKLGSTKLPTSPLAISAVVPNDPAGRGLVIEREARNYSSFIQLRHFLLALLPTVLLGAMGFFFQRSWLRTHFIGPVEALAETSVGHRPVDRSWPLEIQEISEKLSEAFSNREQAVFGQVARGIIHDIRTNLHSMHTATQLVEGAADPDIRKGRLEKLYSACSRNIPKIRSIVDMSLDTSREISMKPQLGDVGDTIEQAMDTLEEMAQAKGITIKSDLPGDLVAMHDPVQMERVIVNLIRNALEAVDESPTGKLVKVSAIKSDREVTIAVEDSGPGLPNVNAIFRPLKSSKVHGVGLGLFLSKKIVEAHSGQLQPGSSPSLGGAKFTVTLPQEVRL